MRRGFKRYFIIAYCLLPIAYCLFSMPSANAKGAAKPIAQTPYDQQVNANKLLQQGIQSYNSSRFRDAILFFEDSIALYRQLDDRLGESEVLGYLGNTYQALGEYRKAIEYHQQQLAITKGEFTLFTNTVNGLGIEQSSYLNTLLQREVYQKEIDAFNNLGNDYLLLGQSQPALSSYQQSLEISEKIDDNSAKALSFHNLGKVQAFLKQDREAIAFYQQSLSIFQNIKYRYGEATVLKSFGDSYQTLGDYQQTIDYYQQSLTIQKEIGNFQGEIQSLIDLGKAYHSWQNDRTATESYYQSLVISKKINDRLGERAALSSIGLLLSQKQPELAILFYKQSVNVTESIRKDIQGLPQSIEIAYTQKVADTYHRLSDLLEQDHRPIEARQVLDLLKVSQIQTRGKGSQKGVTINSQERQIWRIHDDLLNQAVSIDRELAQLEKILPRDRNTTQQQRISQLLSARSQLLQSYTNLLQ